MATEFTTAHGRRRRPTRTRHASVFTRTQTPRAHLLSRVLRVFGAIILVSVISITAAFAYLYSHYSKIVDRRLAAGYLTTRAGLYAAPRVLRPGQKLTPERLSEALRRAGYVDGEASRVWNGRFRMYDGGIEIQPNNADDAIAAQAFGVVRVGFDKRGQIDSITGDGVRLDSFTLEPEPLTGDASEKTSEHAALSYADVPPVLARAILSIEDRRFFEHGPLDLWAIARAALSWGSENQDFKQGGSTITQQLVKNTYLTPERTLKRKFHEAALASVIERRMSKEDIFALYCNEIYLGQRGSIAVRGIRQAARVFFGKELKELTLAEAATIAGMIQSPGRYAPDRHPDNAKVRRNTVLAAMLRDEAISKEDARAAADSPVTVAPLARADAIAPHFIDYASRVAESRLAPSASESEQSLRVYTTLDLELQQIAEEAVEGQLARLEKVFKGRKRPQAALVALDPKTGHVLAMVGGDSYATSQLNRATDARRQPGSVFKPVVYAAAMESGISPLTLSSDAPREFTYDLRSKYRPANYGGAFSMRDVTMRTGLVRSLNVVTVDAALRTGLVRVATLAEQLGLPKPQGYPSLALGTTEATPLEVAASYTAFASGGRVARPNPLVRVSGASDSQSLEETFVVGEQILKPATAYMLTDMLSDVIDRGTARSARGMLKGLAVAGKTGTSRDGWFAGYTPNLVCVVWVGFDDGSELNLTGADSALPAWAEFVRRAVELRPELGGKEFARPASVAKVEIDPETGQLASASCPQRETVAVAPAFVPNHECSLHGDPWGINALAEAMAADAESASDHLQGTSATNFDEGERASASSNSYATHGATGAQLVEASVKEELPPREPRRATQVVVGRDGRRTLTNDIQVAPKGADDWQD